MHPKMVRLELLVPRAVSAAELANYVRDAVNRWSGEFHPDDPRKLIEVISIDGKSTLTPLTAASPCAALADGEGA